MNGRVILVAAVGGADGSRAAAAALACAGSEPDRPGLLIDVGARPPRPTLLASSGARELEERLAVHLPELRAAARGGTCHLAIPGDAEGLERLPAAARARGGRRSTRAIRLFPGCPAGPGRPAQRGPALRRSRFESPAPRPRGARPARARPRGSSPQATARLGAGPACAVWRPLGGGSGRIANARSQGPLGQWFLTRNANRCAAAPIRRVIHRCERLTAGRDACRRPRRHFARIAAC